MKRQRSRLDGRKLSTDGHVLLPSDYPNMAKHATTVISLDAMTFAIAMTKVEAHWMFSTRPLPPEDIPWHILRPVMKEEFRRKVDRALDPEKASAAEAAAAVAAGTALDPRMPAVTPFSTNPSASGSPEQWAPSAATPLHTTPIGFRLWDTLGLGGPTSVLAKRMRELFAAKVEDGPSGRTIMCVTRGGRIGDTVFSEYIRRVNGPLRDKFPEVSLVLPSLHFPHP